MALCPSCKTGLFKVRYSDSTSLPNRVIRNRCCDECGYREETVERIEGPVKAKRKRTAA